MCTSIVIVSSVLSNAWSLDAGGLLGRCEAPIDARWRHCYTSDGRPEMEEFQALVMREERTNPDLGGLEDDDGVYWRKGLV